MLIVTIISEDHISINNIASNIKIVVEVGALPNSVENTNDDSNDNDINEVAIARNIKKELVYS